MKKKKEERESWESTCWYEVQVQKRREKQKTKKRVPESVCQSKVCGKKKLKKYKKILYFYSQIKLDGRMI